MKDLELVVETGTPFLRQNFSFWGGYLCYHNDGILHHASEQFVARFKYNRKRKASFLTFLIKNFTQEEYFSGLANGETPLGMLEAKGYAPRTRRR